MKLDMKRRLQVRFVLLSVAALLVLQTLIVGCLLYTSDAADD